MLLTDGTSDCVGAWPALDGTDHANPPTGRFVAVSTSLEHSCGLRTGGTIECWGRPLGGELLSPEGEFSSVAAGSRHSCGLRTDGTVACWGSEDQPALLDAPGGHFRAVAASSWHTCGVRDDGRIDCWGMIRPPPADMNP